MTIEFDYRPEDLKEAHRAHLRSLLRLRGATSRRQDLFVCLALAALVFAVFAPVATHDFFEYDDPAYVGRAAVQRGMTLAGIAEIFRDFSSPPYYTPITHITHMLDYSAWGERRGLHHLSSVAFHAANAVVLYLLLLQWTRRRWAVAMTAALFALHPLRVESVAWMAARKDLVSALFLLMALHAYTAYARQPTIGRYLLMATLLGLGLLAKPILMVAPILLFLLDYWPLKRFTRGPVGLLVAEKAPLLLMSLACGLATVIAQRNAGAVQSLEQFPLSFRLANAIVSYARYLEKTFLPINLSVFYPPPSHWPVWTLILSATILIVVTVLALSSFRRRPYVAVGWLWFVITLLPVIGLIQAGEQAMADRFTYLPHIGLCMMICFPGAELMKSRGLAIGIAALVLLPVSARSLDQLHHWKNSETLFIHALTVTRDNKIAHNQLGNALVRRRDYAEAQQHYRAAVRIDPRYALAQMNLGNVLVHDRAFAEAAEHYRAALAIDPKLARAHLGLGFAFRGLDQLDASADAFRRALVLDPSLIAAEQQLDQLHADQTTRPAATRP